MYCRNNRWEKYLIHTVLTVKWKILEQKKAGEKLHTWNKYKLKLNGKR